jgi:hypothetical protein
MTIGTNTARASFNTDGTSTVFPVPIQAYLASDFTVILTNNATGVETTLALGSDYTVVASSSDAPPKWTLTTQTGQFASPYIGGSTLQVILNPPEVQQTQYVQGQAFPSSAVQANMDRLTQMIIRLSDLQSRSIVAPDGDINPSMALPRASLRANLAPLFDANGNLVLGMIPTTALTQTIFNNFLAGSVPYLTTPAETTVGAPIVNPFLPPLTPDRYGTNANPGTTDMTIPIKTAWKVAVAQGGGVIKFINAAVYLVASLDATNPSVGIAAQQSNGSIVSNPFQVQFYCLGGSNITFDFAGALIKSTLTGGGIGFLLDNCSNIRFISPNFLGTQVQGGGVVSVGSLVGGSGYVNGTYTNVLMSGGTGLGCACTIVVAGGAVTSCVPTYAGGSTTALLSGGYQIGDVLSTSNANLGGSGSGFSVHVTSALGAGNVVQTASILPICVVSNSGLSTGISTYDLTATACYNGFDVIDGLNPNGITSTNISLLGKTVVQGPSEYGVNLNNGGDGTFIENLYTSQVNRPFFFYGVQGATVARLDAEATNYGFGSIIKSYSRSTSGISLNGLFRNAPGNPTPHIAIQVQCDPAVITVPPTVKNIYIKHDDFNEDQSDAIEIDYFAGSGGTVLTATSSNQLFDQIWLQGISAGGIKTNVKLTTAAAQCQINYDNFEAAGWSGIFGDPRDIRNGNGFIASRSFFSTMSLTFGGTTVTGASIAVDTSIADGLCTVKGTCTLTAKNGSGAAVLNLPFKSRLDATANSLGVVLGASGMVGLITAPIVGFLSGNSNALNLVQQAATNIQNVTDTNFSTSSVLYFQISYPI